MSEILTQLPEQLPDLSVYLGSELDYQPLPWQADFSLQPGMVIKVRHEQFDKTYIFECMGAKPGKRISGYFSEFDGEQPLTIRSEEEISLIHPVALLAQSNTPSLEFHKYSPSVIQGKNPGHSILRPAYDSISYVDLAELNLIANQEAQRLAATDTLKRTVTPETLGALVGYYRFLAVNPGEKGDGEFFERMASSLEQDLKL